MLRMAKVRLVPKSFKGFVLNFFATILGFGMLVSHNMTLLVVVSLCGRRSPKFQKKKFAAQHCSLWVGCSMDSFDQRKLFKV